MNVWKPTDLPGCAWYDFVDPACNRICNGQREILNKATGQWEPFTSAFSGQVSFQSPADEPVDEPIIVMP